MADPNIEPSDPANGEHPLNEILAGLYQAGLFAQTQMQKTALSNMDNHFEADGTPKTVNLGGSELPTYSLVHHHSLQIAELTVKFKAKISNFTAQPPDAKGFFYRLLHLQFGQATPEYADIEIKFKGGDAPEGTAKVNDKLLKKFPV